jgi:hypothetical protein
VTKSITLTKSQIEGRERIRQYKVQQRPTHKPAKKGRVSRLREGLEPAGDPEGIPCGAYGQCVVCWTDVGGDTVWLRRCSEGVPKEFPYSSWLRKTLEQSRCRLPRLLLVKAMLHLTVAIDLYGVSGAEAASASENCYFSRR